MDGMDGMDHDKIRLAKWPSPISSISSIPLPNSVVSVLFSFLHEAMPVPGTAFFYGYSRNSPKEEFF